MGLLSVMVPLEAQDQEGRQLSVLQVVPTPALGALSTACPRTAP